MSPHESATYVPGPYPPAPNSAFQRTGRFLLEQLVIWWTLTVRETDFRPRRMIYKVTHQEVVFAEMGRVRTVVQGPDGYLISAR